MTDDRPPRPDPLGVNPDAVPELLTERETWVCWRYKYKPDRDTWTKVPVDADTGWNAKSNDPKTWVSFATALAYHERAGTDTDGIGFMVHDGDTVLGLDLDDVRDPDTGDLEPWADDVLDDVPTYAEVSPSGTGLRLFGLGFVPDGGTRGDVDAGAGHLEMYDSGRFLTVTGQQIDGAPDDVCQVNDEIGDLHAEHIADPEPERDTPKPAGDGGVKADSPGANPGVGADKPGSTDAASDLSNDELLEKATTAENGDKFRRLWIGDTAGYPSHSEADLALAGLLAFWTGGDRRRIDRLFRQSDLYREKWDRDDYRERTIDKALTGRSEFYDPGAHSREATSRPNDPGDDLDAGVDVDWSRVKALYASEERGTTTQANNEAADLICEEFTFIAIRETGSVYFYNDERGIYERRGKRYLDQQIADKLDEHYNTNRARNIREKVVNQNYTSDDEFTPPEGKLCLKNGVLDLEARTLEEHDPEHNFTARLNVAYDETADVEHWGGFLEESVERESEIKKLEEFMGYCLEAWHHERHKNLFVVGPTQSGKSTFAEVVQSMFGEPPTLVNLSPQQLADTRFDSGQLKDAMLNTVNDINSSKIENSGKLKRIFAGERIKMEDKNKDPAFRAPNAKHLYTANWLPTVVGQDESLYRRILVVEFPETVAREDRDKDLPDKLVSELSGILNRVLDARERLHEQDGFTNDRSRDDTRKLWDSWQDAHKRFLYTQFEITGDGADTVQKDVYYQAYKEFAGREGYQIKPKQAVTKSLQWVPEIGVPSEGDSYTGLVWRDTDAADGASYKPESQQAGLSMTPQDERKGKIKHTVTRFATPLEAADRQQLVDYLAGKMDLGSRGDLEDEIDALLENGELVEPATGKLRRS